jgi:hypothetical protein
LTPAWPFGHASVWGRLVVFVGGIVDEAPRLVPDLSLVLPCALLGWGVERVGGWLVGGVGTLLGPEESGRFSLPDPLGGLLWGPVWVGGWCGCSGVVLLLSCPLVWGWGVGGVVV